MKNQTPQKSEWILKSIVSAFLLAVMSTVSFAQPVVCNAHFNHYGTSNPGEVHFSAAQNPPGTTYAWDFGDGGTGSQHAPNHTYAQSGAYYVCLTVTDSSNGNVLCTSTHCDTIHVNIPVPVCNAHFNYNHGFNLAEIHFSPAQNPSGSTYAWDFGDGSTGSSHFPVHIYNASGAYYVCLTVTDSLNGNILCTDTYCDTVHVQAPPPPVCNAHFNFHPEMNPGNIDFSGASNPAGTTYAWDFGDGGSSSQHSPNHTYAQSGSYYVCLTVTDSSAGNILCTDTWCDTVDVIIPVPVCNAHFAHYSSNTNYTNVHFYGGSNPYGTTYAWDFGDGTVSNLHAPAHTYAAAGTYYVCLTVTDSSGGNILCTDTWCDSVVVAAPQPVCNAHFHANHSGGNNLNVHFSAPQNPPGTIAYAWDFGDGSTSTAFNPTHLYAQEGTYYVCLTVTDSSGGSGCTATWCDSVDVSNHPCGNGHDHLRTSSALTVGQPAGLVYPNPVTENSILHIENTVGSVTFRIVDNMGKLVMEKENLSNGDFEFTKNNLSQGIYFYRINDDGGNVLEGKLIVQ
jgi:PKD repeat protein